MVRLFIAVNLSEQQRHELVQLQNRFKRNLDGVKWVKPEGMHLTLKFLGETDSQMVSKISGILDLSGEIFSSFQIDCSGCGIFPNPARARVIWSGINKGSKDLSDLAEFFNQELSGLGFQPEKRAFMPHLTLGRFRNPVTEKIVNSVLKEEADFQSKSSLVDQVVLYESVLTRHGAIYKPVYRTGLNKSKR